MMIAALPAVVAGFFYYGMPAAGVVSLSIASAILWELGFNYVAKRELLEKGGLYSHLYHMNYASIEAPMAATAGDGDGA